MHIERKMHLRGGGGVSIRIENASEKMVSIERKHAAAFFGSYLIEVTN